MIIRKKTKFQFVGIFKRWTNIQYYINLKSFKILKNSEVSEVSVKKIDSTTNNEVAFVFENNDNTIENISNYVAINKVNLLCVNRTSHKKDKSTTSLSLTANINDIIKNINVPVILMGQTNYSLQ